LYEVDMRLRPTGNKGPVAVSLQSFTEYHASQSWTWEHMALTRARLIAGPPQLQARVAADIRRRLTQLREASVIIADARDMRARMAETFPGRNLWDLKYAPGGLVDIEFIAQSLQLIHAPALPEILDTNTMAALEKLRDAGLLSVPDAEVLIAAAGLQHALTQVLRIALDETPVIEDATPGLKALLTRAAEAAVSREASTAGSICKGQRAGSSTVCWQSHKIFPAERQDAPARRAAWPLTATGSLRPEMRIWKWLRSPRKVEVAISPATPSGAKRYAPAGWPAGM
jgi:glutamine synthetase adenylyltransferase